METARGRFRGNMSIEATALAYAKGAAWHLRAAAPQLNAVWFGAAGPRGGDMFLAARRHLDQAGDDLVVLRHLLEQNQQIGGELLAGIDDALRATQQKSIELAGRQAWRAVNRLTALVGDTQPLAVRSLATTAPLADRELVTTAEAARMYRRTDPGTAESVERVLRSGDRLEDTRSVIGAAGNFNGDIEVISLRDAANRARQLRALTKPPDAQAAHEELTYLAARRLGIDHMFPVTVRRADGTAYIEMLDGVPFWKADIRSGGDIDNVLVTWYRSNFPNLPVHEAQRAARTDRELLQFMDYLLANNDRHVANGFVDDARTWVYFIDGGFAGRGETVNALMPRLKHFYQGPGGRTTLSPETVTHIRQHLNDRVLGELHDVLRQPAGAMSAESAARLAVDASPRYLDRMKARLQHVLKNGEYQYHPIGDDVHPLQTLPPDLAIRG